MSAPYPDSPVHNDQFARYAGIRLVEIGRGYAVSELEPADYHLNGVGIVHGGAIFTLADIAFAAAANSYEDIAVAVNITVSFFQAVQTGCRLTATAREVSRSRKLATYQIDVQDEAGNPIAAMQGTAYRKSNPKPSSPGT